MQEFKHLSVSLFALLAVSVFTVPAAAQDGEVGYLRTRISPRVAGVFVDGEYYGSADMFGFRDQAIRLKPGTYEVKILDPRYKPIVAKVSVKKGEYTVIRHWMTPLETVADGPFGELAASGFGNSAVYINGKYYANAKELESSVRTVLLQPGQYDMRIVSVDGETEREEKITINEDETLVIDRRGGSARRR